MALATQGRFHGRLEIVQQPFQDPSPVFHQSLFQTLLQGAQIPLTGFCKLTLDYIEEGFGFPVTLRLCFLGFFLLSSAVSKQVICSVTSANCCASWRSL
jgi:hypothetical protein